MYPFHCYIQDSAPPSNLEVKHKDQNYQQTVLTNMHAKYEQTASYSDKISDRPPHPDEFQLFGQPVLHYL